jgi:putative NADH-flavin reductase
MKVIVFGSTGTIGKHLIEQSLNEGHHVTAFLRDSGKLENIKRKNLSLFEGDVLNKINVESAIENHDAVIIALGAGKDRKSTIRSQGTKVIIEAMKTKGVKRLICNSTLGVGESNNNLNFFWKHIMFGWFLKKAFLDHVLQEKYVKESGLEWTIVRPAAFTDGQKTSTYKHGFDSNDKSTQLKISRADVADFIINQLNNKNYLHKTPGLSY